MFSPSRGVLRTPSPRRALRRLACAAAFGLVSLMPSSAAAANRFRIDEAGALVAGAPGQSVAVIADTDIDITGFSVGVDYDEGLLRATGVSVEGTASEGAEFVDGSILPETGKLGFGVVFDLAAGTVLPAAPDRAILKMQLDVTTETEATAAFLFGPVQVDADTLVENVLVDAEGRSVLPELVDGSVPIESHRPRILSLSENSGFAGDVFTVSGEFLDEPDRSVTVCSQPAEAVLDASGDALHVTAPACDTLGFARVEVCTARGCDAVEEGFFYETPPAPAISALSENEGRAGDTFTVQGENLGFQGLSVTVCGVETGAELQPDGSVLVTAPECGTDGFAALELCTAGGCDSEPEGFLYQALLEFVRGDANSDGRVDIGDAVFSLVFLFQGGPAGACRDGMDANDDGRLDIGDPIYTLGFMFSGGPSMPPPFPEAGLDPTSDSLPDCRVD